MTEIEEGLVDQAGNQDQLALPEETPDPGHDETEDEEVVEDEMAAHVRRGGDPFGVCRVEVPVVDSLQDKQDDPVNARNQGIETKGGAEMLILAPDGVLVRSISFIRGPEGMQDAHNDHQQPGDNCEDFVGDE